MNEILFLIQLLIIVGFALGSIRFGKGALIAWVSIQALVANLFVLKQIRLFGFHVTASDAFVIGSLLGLNFLQEYYGKEDARKGSWICFYFMAFFALVSQLHLLYQPSQLDTSQSAFITILSPAPRLLLASLAVFFIVQQFDIYFFGWLKKLIPHLHFGYRAAISLVASQFLDTVLFSFAGLYGLVSSLFDIMLVSFCIKVIVIFCLTPFVRLARE